MTGSAAAETGFGVSLARSARLARPKQGCERGGDLVDPRDNGRDLIVFEGVCKTYPMGELEVRALRNVDLSIKEGS
jgi:hypothetical protein